MNELEHDLKSIVDILKDYADNGTKDITFLEVKEPRAIPYFPELQRPLARVSSFDGRFVAIDCSTKPLMKGNQFGIYLFRPAYAIVDLANPNKADSVTWGLLPGQERLRAAAGDWRKRSYELERYRAQFESELAESLLEQLGPSDYLLLDGASYFGERGGRRFSEDVYNKARQKGLRFLTISKNSPSLLDGKGRDLMSQIAVMAQGSGAWVYHPIAELKADHKNRWGDASFVKFSPSCFRIFRCDIMDYLTEGDIVQLLSPLTLISEDPRSLGYPAALYLAHDFAKVTSDAKLLYYRDIVEKTLVNTDEDLLHCLKFEEALSNFRSEMYGMKYPWQMSEHMVM